MTDEPMIPPAPRFLCPAGHAMPAKEWCGDCGTHVVPVVAGLTAEDVVALTAAARHARVEAAYAAGQAVKYPSDTEAPIVAAGLAALAVQYDAIAAKITALLPKQPSP